MVHSPPQWSLNPVKLTVKINKPHSQPHRELREIRSNRTCKYLLFTTPSSHPHPVLFVYNSPAFHSASRAQATCFSVLLYLPRVSHRGRLIISAFMCFPLANVSSASLIHRAPSRKLRREKKKRYILLPLQGSPACELEEAREEAGTDPSLLP